MATEKQANKTSDAIDVSNYKKQKKLDIKTKQSVNVKGII